MADTHVEALRSSVGRLRGLVGAMGDEDLTRPAYPTDWSIADVLSHLGSGAVILQRRLEDGLAGRDSPDDYAPGVWDTWNAKPARTKRADALVADGDLLARIDGVGREERQ